MPSLMCSLLVAVLMNGGKSKNSPDIKKSFISSITSAVDPTGYAEVDFYDPIDAQIYPDVSKYDLIVLSGGSVDPMSKEPWVLKMQDFVRTTVAEHPKTKILGICWGHQTICITFGGSVGPMEEAELGVRSIPLTTPTGTSFLPSSSSTPSYSIHEFHARQVTRPPSPSHFTPLATNNQSFINTSKTILTFQGHPEMNAELAKKLLANVPSYMGVGEEKGERERIEEMMDKSHDGGLIWRRIVEWVHES